MVVSKVLIGATPTHGYCRVLPIKVCACGQWEEEEEEEGEVMVIV